MNKEEKITISVNEEDVQNIINAYEKDIEYINQLEKELEQLKEIEKEHQRINGNLREEIKELKKQLEENQNPLKGIFAQVNDDTLLRDCGNMNAEINELKNQQKDNWNKLKEYCQDNSFMQNTREYGTLTVVDADELAIYMEELESGDSNE